MLHFRVHRPAICLSKTFEDLTTLPRIHHITTQARSLNSNGNLDWGRSHCDRTLISYETSLNGTANGIRILTYIGR
jgi:hypothetical protein